jgi:hypothetical protein
MKCAPMKFLCLFLIVSGSLLAQTVTPANPLAESFFYITGVAGNQNETVVDSGMSSLPGYLTTGPTKTSPSSTGSVTYSYSATSEAMAPFYNQFPDGETTYSPLLRSPLAVNHPDLTTVQPVAPPDLEMLFLDASGTNSLVALDLTQSGIISQVVVPNISGPYGIRPSATGTPTEVWVANGGTEVSVVNLSAQTLVNIPTPSLPQGTQPVAGIVFVNSGATALEAVGFYTPDSAGNNGALLAFDAAGRTLTSTLPLKYTPSAIVASPDGLNAYILSQGGMLTYYDVLSGTADLSVSTYSPGLFGGYGGTGNKVFIHPDGTRLFWNINYLLDVFDLNSRQNTLLTSGLPSTAGPAMWMSQDGGRVYFLDREGDLVVLDTQNGKILATFNIVGAGWFFGGPPVAP